ncbi:hypothetical protein HDU92_001130 [Lobulomyces angularis]|nr:hypothetical protein HDU92_001130 [Lobulomyces angularis]
MGECDEEKRKRDSERVGDGEILEVYMQIKKFCLRGLNPRFPAQILSSAQKQVEHQAQVAQELSHAQFTQLVAFSCQIQHPIPAIPHSINPSQHMAQSTNPHFTLSQYLCQLISQVPGKFFFKGKNLHKNNAKKERKKKKILPSLTFKSVVFQNLFNIVLSPSSARANFTYLILISIILIIANANPFPRKSEKWLTKNDLLITKTITVTKTTSVKTTSIKTTDTTKTTDSTATKTTLSSSSKTTNSITTSTKTTSTKTSTPSIIFGIKSPSGKIQEYSTSKVGAKSWTLNNFNGATDAYSALFGQHQTSTDPSWRDIVDDPLGGPDKVMRVTYGKGSFGSKSNGGQTFYAQPPIDWQNAKKVEFCYHVMFDKDFDFYKMGKLPGLFSGAAENCIYPNYCWSSRYMWRQGGQGEIYPTIDLDKQPKGFCANPKQCLNGSGNQGISVGRGSFTFPTGSWFPICQVIRGTTNDGEMTVYVNNKSSEPVINWKNLVYANVGFTGIQFGTFFGGGDNEQSPKTQHSYFKKFSLKVLE